MTITCVGGDIRQLYLAKILLNNHYQVQMVGFSKNDWDTAFPVSHSDKKTPKPQFFTSQQLTDAFAKSEIILGPIPLSKDGKTISCTNASDTILLSQLLNSLKSSHYFIGGLISNSIKDILQKNNITYYDYLSNASFARLNAIATAEGAISYAIEHSPGNLHQSNVLILGYGTCGSILAKKCQGLNANVTVAGRRPETKALAISHGHQYLDIATLEQCHELSSFQYIFSTIPALVLTKEILQKISLDCTIVDIASAPGSADYNFLQKRPINATLYLGIPGKIAPKASAQILFDIIINRLQERSRIYVAQSL